MRIIRLGAALAAVLMPAAAMAQDDIDRKPGSGGSASRVVTLASDEVLLTVRGKGLQVSRPDFASQLIIMATGGADNSAAVSANQQLRARVRKIITDAEVDPSGIQMLQGEATTRIGFVGNEVFVPDQIAAAPPQKPAPKSFASSSMLVRLTDMGKLDKIRTQLQSIAEVQLANATYGLNDDSPAKRAAVDQALAKAKIDAGIYAKAMNMKVGRVVAVRDIAGSLSADSFMEMMAERGQMPGAGVRTEARIEVDVVLKPL